MVRSISQACREAKIESHGLRNGDFRAEHYVIKNQSIGTGLRRSMRGPKHCMFKFNEAPNRPYLFTMVAALAYFHETNKDRDEDVEELKARVIETLNKMSFATGEVTTEKVKYILGNVEYLRCTCSPIPPDDPQTSNCS